MEHRTHGRMQNDAGRAVPQGSGTSVGPSLLQNNKMSGFALTFAIYLKYLLLGSPLPSGEPPPDSLAAQTETPAGAGARGAQPVTGRAAAAEGRCCAGGQAKSFPRAAGAFPCHFPSLFFINGLRCLLLLVFIWLFSFNE